MEGIPIVGSFDLATLIFTLFNLFFVGLVFYLAREGRREGYPLESDETGKLESIGANWMPKPKTYKLSDGREIHKPDGVRDPSIDDKATRMAPWAGAPIEPVGDPMQSGIGPGAYTMREDIPDMTHENLPKIVPLSAMPEFSVAKESADPRGFDVVGADGEVAGKISDIWMDRAEALVRYYEVEVAADGRKVLMPYAFADVKGKASVVDVPSITAAQFTGVPAHASSTQVTRLEEDKISAYYASGTLYATSERVKPLI
ncbi:photosynthetic reaction center subunit H [Maricaulaceae bacterium NA33B04]|nr:photosynthetic reaction center subunit H [Maricaulaceae bacterium NA33B04]